MRARKPVIDRIPRLRLGTHEFQALQFPDILRRSVSLFLNKYTAKEIALRITDFGGTTAFCGLDLGSNLPKNSGFDAARTRDRLFFPNFFPFQPD